MLNTKNDIATSVDRILTRAERNPIDIHWEQSGAEYVCESTGFFTTPLV